MAKYDAAAKEKAYELLMIQAVPHQVVVREMKKNYPTFATNTLTSWRHDPKLNWEGRYQNYCQAIAARTDKELVKSIKPVLHTIQDIREKVYNKLVKFLERDDVITERNIGLVLSSFVKMADLEFKIAGGGKSSPPVKEVMAVVFMILERHSKIGPEMRMYKNEIEDAIYKEITEGP